MDAARSHIVAIAVLGAFCLAMCRTRHRKAGSDQDRLKSLGHADSTRLAGAPTCMLAREAALSSDQARSRQLVKLSGLALLIMTDGQERRRPRRLRAPMGLYRWPRHPDLRRDVRRCRPQRSSIKPRRLRPAGGSSMAGRVSPMRSGQLVGTTRIMGRGVESSFVAGIVAALALPVVAFILDSAVPFPRCHHVSLRVALHRTCALVLDAAPRC